MGDALIVMKRMSECIKAINECKAAAFLFVIKVYFVLLILC